jgi:hypothetical protein
MPSPLFSFHVPTEQITDEDLKSAFEMYGQVLSTTVVKDPFTNRNRY